jgi:hypothetical protein
VTTSGTVAQTPITVDTLITHAIQRCGKLPSTAGGELLQRARESLYFMLADLGNDGINLWCVNKSVVAVQPYSTAYQLPRGTVDVTDILYRELWDLAGAYSSPSPTELVFTCDQATPVYNITADFAAAGRVTLAAEYSFDNVVWNTLVILQPVDVVLGASFVLDLDNSALAQYWRLREVTALSMVPMDNVRMRKVNNELLLSKLNKDDYTNLPNKQYTGQKPLQYWFDKQIDPRVWVWPIPTQNRGQLVFWAAQQPQDPGSMTNELAVPARWYRYVQAALAHQVAFLIPKNELPPGRLGELKIDAEEARLRASNGESDGSSYQLAPLIGGYTK